jgi:hypothetical protein
VWLPAWLPGGGVCASSSTLFRVIRVLPSSGPAHTARGHDAKQQGDISQYGGTGEILT